MRKQSPLLLLLLLLFVFSPTLISWILATGGNWYRPYMIWLGVVVVSYFIQRNLAKKL